MANDQCAKHCKRKRDDQDLQDDQDSQSWKRRKLQDSAGSIEPPQYPDPPQCPVNVVHLGADGAASQRIDVPCGLVNLGNTCYMNAALQSLGSVVPLKEYFFTRATQDDLNSRDCIAHEISSVIRLMWNKKPHQTAIQPANIMNEIGKSNSRFNGGSQQDSQEFLLCLLNKLHAAMKESCSEDHSSGSDTTKYEAERKWREYLNMHGKSIVVDVFEGQFQSSMKCAECKEFTYKFDPFMFLPTPIPRIEKGKQLQLSDCLEKVFKEEAFGGKAWVCSKCHKNTDMKRKLSISRMPQIVMIYLKRFQSDMYGRKVKVNTIVNTPLRDLDLSCFMSCQSHSIPKYRLFSVISHSGTINGGHYSAYANREGQWFHFNDEYVQQCSEQNTMSSQAYVLFYGKQNEINEDSLVVL